MKKQLTLSKAQNVFTKIGCTVLVSSEKVIEAITDKLKTYEMIKAAI